jgi:TRAP-type mannitol/chloroaromatic compound transport system substrate-binding protein
LAEKKIIAISRQELLFLRKSISNIFNKEINSPGDKGAYEELAKDITHKNNIEASAQRHSPGLLHKLMHDEGHNRDFLDTCYRYISDNKHSRDSFLQEVGLPILPQTDKTEKNSTVTNWKSNFWYLTLSITVVMSVLAVTYTIHSYKESQKKIVLNMTTAWNAESYTHTHYLENFVNQVKNETNGRLEIHIFPDFQLPNSNGHNRSKEEVIESLMEGSVDILHSGPYLNIKENPEAIMFSTIPFGKNYQQMVAWVEKPKIKKTLRNLFIKDNLITYPGGHSGPQYGGWYKELPKDTNFFFGKTIRFANFAGLLLSQPAIGAKQKPMLRYQFESMVDHINFDVVEWQNPEEDVKMNMHLKGFRYYDSSHWNEPNAMFCFYFNKKTLENLPEDIREIVVRLLDKVGKQKIFSDDSPQRQLAENTIENTLIPSCNCKIKIFDMQFDCPKTYQYLKVENNRFLNDFSKKNPSMKWLYEDYKSNK